MKTKFARYFLVAILVLGLLPAFPALAAPPPATVNSPVTPANSAWRQSQIDGWFPEKNPTTRLFAQNRRVFKAYRDRGQLTIVNHGATSAEVYVNGQRLVIAAALASPAGKVTVDIGRYTRNGDNALKVLNITPVGAAIDISIPYPELIRAEPAAAGFSAAKLAQVDELIRAEVSQGFPGAVLLVLKDGKIVKNTAYGWQKKYDGDQLLTPAQPMTVDTLFDLASNTKVYATVLALMKLTAEGRVNPEDRLSAYLANFTGDGREELRIRDLLTHSAGFAPEINYFDPNEAGAFYSLDRTTTLQLTEKAPLSYPPGSKTVYSDTDFILLGHLLEQVVGQPLDQYVEEQIYQPLGLTHTLFNPLQKRFTSDQFAATERNGNTRDHTRFFPTVRTNTIQGEVHDEKAFYSLGGVAGHAGLFSRSLDLAVLAQTLLNGGGYGGYRLCPPATVTYFTKPADRDRRFGLGWNKGGHPDTVYEFGPYAGDQVIGHTGWVGIDSCIDPKHDMAIILLTNKVHAPVVPGERNRFTTANFETGKYGSIISLVYEALLETEQR